MLNKLYLAIALVLFVYLSFPTSVFAILAFGDTEIVDGLTYALVSLSSGYMANLFFDKYKGK